MTQGRSLDTKPDMKSYPGSQQKTTPGLCMNFLSEPSTGSPGHERPKPALPGPGGERMETNMLMNGRGEHGLALWASLFLYTKGTLQPTLCLVFVELTVKS